MASASERWNVLEDLDDWLRLPMALLSLAWLLIVVAELAWGEHHLLATFGLVIWIVFLAEFAIRFILAPEKLPFLRRNWLTVLALALPALRIFRALRVVRAARVVRGWSAFVGTPTAAGRPPHRRSAAAVGYAWAHRPAFPRGLGNVSSNPGESGRVRVL